MLAGGLIFLTHLMMGQDVSGDSWQQHVRSPLWAGSVAVAILLMLALHRASPGIWLVVAGATANAASWAYTGKIPDYLTAVVGDRWIAYNLADVSIVFGALTVMSTLLVRAEHQIRNARAH